MKIIINIILILFASSPLIAILLACGQFDNQRDKLIKYVESLKCKKCKTSLSVSYRLLNTSIDGYCNNIDCERCGRSKVFYMGCEKELEK